MVGTLPTVCSTSQTFHASIQETTTRTLSVNQWLFTVSWLTSCQNRPFIIDQYHINKQPHCHYTLSHNFVPHFVIRLWKTLPENVLLKRAISIVTAKTIHRCGTGWTLSLSELLCDHTICLPCLFESIVGTLGVQIWLFWEVLLPRVVFVGVLYAGNNKVFKSERWTWTSVQTVWTQSQLCWWCPLVLYLWVVFLWMLLNFVLWHFSWVSRHLLAYCYFLTSRY